MSCRVGSRGPRNRIPFGCPGRQSHAWVAMQVETKSMRLFKPAAWATAAAITYALSAKALTD